MTTRGLIRVRLGRPSSAGAWQAPHYSGLARLSCCPQRRGASQHTPTLPQHLDWIVGKDRIMTNEDRFFHVGLDDEQPVKRVFVMGRQVLQRQDMPKGDRQDLDLVGLLLAGDHLCQG